MAQLALRWILGFDAVSTAIPGAKSPEQARANAAAAELPPLPPAVLEGSPSSTGDESRRPCISAGEASGRGALRSRRPVPVASSGRVLLNHANVSRQTLPRTSFSHRTQ